MRLAAKLARVTAIVAAAALVTSAALAQQRPTPIPSGDQGGGGGGAGGHHARTPVIRFPMPAGTYQHYIAEPYVARMHKLEGKLGITAGDVDKWLLLFKECTSNAMADNVVTRTEASRCFHVPGPKADFKEDQPHPPGPHPR